MFTILGKRGGLLPLLEVLSYTSQFTRMQSVLRYPLVRMVEKKMYFAKEATHHMKRRRQKHVSFNVLYTKETLFNIMYVHMEHRAVCLLSKCYDLTATGYKYLEIGINVRPPSYVEIALGDHRGYELSLSLETWKGLYEQQWNIYKVLRNEYKDNFKHWTANCQRLHAKWCYAHTSQFFIHTHYDDGNDVCLSLTDVLM